MLAILSPHHPALQHLASSLPRLTSLGPQPIPQVFAHSPLNPTPQAISDFSVRAPIGFPRLFATSNSQPAPSCAARLGQQLASPHKSWPAAYPASICSQPAQPCPASHPRFQHAGPHWLPQAAAPG